MPLNKDFYLRIEIIDSCLRNRLGKWTLQKLIDKVNVELIDKYNKSASRRTIQNDLKYLKNEKNAPIEKVKDGNKTIFYYSDPNFSIKTLPVFEEEVILIKDAIEILRQVSDFKILKDVDNIITKLQSTINLTKEKTPSIIQFESHTIADGTEYIDNLYTAIKERNTLRIFYQPFTNKLQEHLFHPYLLKEYRNRWFVLGRVNNNSWVTIFALDRIKKIKNAIADYIDNNLFDPATYFNNLIGVTIPEQKTIEIIDIRVSKSQAFYITTKPIHFTQQVLKYYSDGDILIRLNLLINYELKSVLLSYGKHIKVIKPIKLKEMMRVELEEAVAAYK